MYYLSCKFVFNYTCKHYRDDVAKCHEQESQLYIRLIYEVFPHRHVLNVHRDPTFPTSLIIGSNLHTYSTLICCNNHIIPN